MSDLRENRIKRLIYQSWYRGCKETDILLGEFAKSELRALDDDGLDSFEALLAEQDVDIYHWLTGQSEVPPHFKHNATYLKIHAFCTRKK